LSVRVLYISGSLGLGHVIRDLSVVKEMRQYCPDIEIEWLAGSPAADVLLSSGEQLVQGYGNYHGETELAEAISHKGSLSLTTYVFRALITWLRNARLIGKVASHRSYDVIVGNETYEIPVANFIGLHVLPAIPFIMMYDFWGMEVTSGNSFEQLGSWILNLVWSQEWRITAQRQNAAIFFGEKEDIPEGRFGKLLPDRRRYAESHVEFVGYPLPFDLESIPPKDGMRADLGYDERPLVICSVGGTSIGKEILELCGRSFPLVQARVPSLNMILIAGPRIDPNSLHVPDGIDCRGMVPQLWRHLAACDLAVVQGGGSTTLELEALRVPFLFFPVEHHAEQEVTVANRLARHGAGVRMHFSSTTPQDLADAIITNLNYTVTYPAIPFDATRLAAKRILQRAGISM
jgi:hypothetical protein